MKTHTELLTNLIAAVYALPIDALEKEIHDLQMLAAETKGQMMAQLPPMMTLDTETGKVTPTPDEDGWIGNTGVMPEIEVLELRFRDGYICNDPAPKTQYRWHFANNCQDPSVDITHYKPA
jgi:hypothetical protein